jgi:hypothetical protein
LERDFCKTGKNPAGLEIRDIQSQGLKFHDKSFMFMLKTGGQNADPVGASLLAKSASSSTKLSTLTPPSRAGRSHKGEFLRDKKTPRTSRGVFL